MKTLAYKNGVVSARSVSSTLDFELPPNLEAGEPPEARGLGRDEVRLMVSYVGTGEVHHAQFRDIPTFLSAGDLLVINTSGTMNAALPARRSDGERLEVHLSTRLPGRLWVVEVRRPTDIASAPFHGMASGEDLELPAGGAIALLAPYAPASTTESDRLWVASLRLPLPLDYYLEEHGFPIRYGYVRREWPLSYYQTVYATERGSAEMPSAGRAFTPELITQLVANGVGIVPLLLHTGVASLEAGEAPYEEFYRVPLTTADAVNQARQTDRRVVAVGTTVVRALETVTDVRGAVHPGQGWTDVVVTPESGFHAANGMLTGLHEPKASHLAMLEALAGREHLTKTYAEAIQESYLWHEFGDLHLILR